MGYMASWFAIVGVLCTWHGSVHLGLQCLRHTNVWRCLTRAQHIRTASRHSERLIPLGLKVHDNLSAVPQF